MKYVVIIGICVVLVTAIVVLLIYRQKKKVHSNEKNKFTNNVDSVILDEANKISPQEQNNDESIIQMDILSIEEIPDENKLVEITENKTFAFVNQLISGLAQTGLSAFNASQAVKSGSEVLYRVIIPAGAKLSNSKSMEGAVRGIYHGANGIKGHANLVAVQNHKGATFLTNTTATAMSIASIVVGQYYMSQINSKLEKVQDEISKISNFQDNEFRSRVFSLVNCVEEIAEFQVEILENDSLRTSKINQLNDLKKECTELLGQVNITLNDFAKNNKLNYTSYEEEIYEANNWYMYQNALINLLYKISDLYYTLNMGVVSREHCNSLLQKYMKQTKDAQASLIEWHETSIKQLGIDINEHRRKREGLDLSIHYIPALFNHNLKYKPIKEDVANMIANQISSQPLENNCDTSDLYTEDVQLICKDGKIYYLPSNKQESYNKST